MSVFVRKGTIIPLASSVKPSTQYASMRVHRGGSGAADWRGGATWHPVTEVEMTTGVWRCVIAYGCFKWQFEAPVAL